MKNYKKVVSAIAALSMVASSLVMPMSASADPVIEKIVVEGGEATVYTNWGVAIVASYDENGRLTALQTATPQADEFGLVDPVLTFDVKVGDKVMLWDSLDSMKPRQGGLDGTIISAVTVTEDMVITPNPTGNCVVSPTPIEETPSPSPTASPEVTDAPTASPEVTDDPNATVWKFDFGSADDVAEGYTAVTADMVYASNKVGDMQFGFHGTDGNGYKVSSRVDGINMQEGQNIELTTGAKAEVASADDDWIGVVDGMYPLRFAMASQPNTYYEVKAVLTTADAARDASVSLYTEKRYPIVEHETISAGETKEVKFTATLQNQYYKGDGVTFENDQFNIVLAGDNAAISSLEITEIEHAPTVWVYTDSTGCAYDAVLPYFGLQNYGGVGQWLTKYLPEGVAMSNQGEGGLDAHDNMHWNCAKANIKAGDYVYVEYGHNHKSDGASGYLSAIPKYYEYAHSVGAYTIFAGPVDRHNASQYTAETNTWTSTLSSFSDAAKSYVEGLIEGGATDVAFVDINEPSLRWMEEVCEEVKAMRGADVYERNATDYYFRAMRGEGGADGTHPNDAGADNLAYRFFMEAKETYDAGQAADAANVQKVQADVLSGLLNGMRPASPYKVSQEVVDAGAAPNEAYPMKYIPPNEYDYPVVIKNVVIEEGAVVQVDADVQLPSKVPMTGYGIIVITVKDADGNEVGTIYALDQVDNSVGVGTQTVKAFTNDVKIEEGYTYSAQVWQALDSDSGLVVDPLNVAYSSVYVPTDVETYLSTDEDGNPVEDFVYYGVEAGTSVVGYNEWGQYGSAGADVTIGTDTDRNYLNIISDGAKAGAANQGSFSLWKQLDGAIGTTGKYQIKGDFKYVSGGTLDILLAENVSTKNMYGSQSISCFKIAANGEVLVDTTSVGALNAGVWGTIDYVLDMDKATATISVAGSDPVVVPVSNYEAITGDIYPSNTNFINFNINKAAIDVKLSNLQVNQLKRDALPTMTLAVSGDAALGTVEASADAAELNTEVTIKATPLDGYVFTGWTKADGTAFAEDAEFTFRLRENLELTANYEKQSGIDGITSYAIAPTVGSVKVGGSTAINLTDVVDANGNPVIATIADMELSCETAGVTIENGVVTIAEDFAIDANSTVDVTIKGVLNGVEKTCTISVYSYAYYEKIGASTNYTGLIMTIAGKNAMVFPGASTTNTYTMTEAVDLTAPTKITLSQAWTGANTCGQKRTYNFKDANGTTILTMYYSWTGLFVNGTELAGAVAEDAYTDIVIEINGTEATVTAGGNSATAPVSGTTLAAIDFASAGSVPGPEARALGVSEIVIEN